MSLGWCQPMEACCPDDRRSFWPHKIAWPEFDMRLAQMGKIGYNYTRTNRKVDHGATSIARGLATTFLGGSYMNDHTPHLSALKVCTKCEEAKPHSEFHKGKDNDGLRPTCKVCEALRVRTRRAVYPGPNYENMRDPRKENEARSICNVEDCDEQPVAKGLCMHHYDRQRKGYRAEPSVRRKRYKATDMCSYPECSKPIGKKGSKGMCSTHYSKVAKAKIYDAIVALKGGRCQRCGGVFHRAVYEFHHRNPEEKKGIISRMISSIHDTRGNAWDMIVEEVNKCDLLCANCHRMVHIDGN